MARRLLHAFANLFGVNSGGDYERAIDDVPLMTGDIGMALPGVTAAGFSKRGARG